MSITDTEKLYSLAVAAKESADKNLRSSEGLCLQTTGLLNRLIQENCPEWKTRPFMGETIWANQVYMEIYTAGVRQRLKRLKRNDRRRLARYGKAVEVLANEDGIDESFNTNQLLGHIGLQVNIGDRFYLVDPDVKQFERKLLPLPFDVFLLDRGKEGWMTENSVSQGWSEPSPNHFFHYEFITLKLFDIENKNSDYWNQDKYPNLLDDAREQLKVNSLE